MKKQRPDPLFSELSPQLILTLGEQLASLPSFEEQNTCLLNFLNHHFQGKAFVFFDNLPKTLKTSEHLNELPFSMDSLFDDQQYKANNYRVIAKESMFWVIVPLMHGADEIGAIILAFEEIPGETKISKLIEIGRIAGLALDASIQAHRLRYQQKQLALVRSVTAQVSQITDLDILTNQITELVQKSFDYYYVAVFLIDEKTEKLQFKSSASSLKSDYPDFEEDTHPGFMLGEHIIGHVAETGCELIAKDVNKEPRYKEVGSLKGTKSEVVLPLKIEDQVFGVFDIQSNQLDAFDETDLLVLRSLADNIAIAIKNARFFAQSQEQAWMSTMLLQVAKAAQSQTSIKDLAETIVKLTPMVVGVEGCALFLFDENSKYFSLQGMYGLPALEEKLASSQPITFLKAPILEALIDSQEPLLVKKPQEDFNLPEDFSDLVQPNTMALLPITARGEFYGALLLKNDAKRPIKDTIDEMIREERMKIIQGITQQTAVAIENLRLLETRQEEAYISTVLLQVAQAVVSNAELNDTLESIVNIMPILVGIESNAIYLWDKSEERFKVSIAAIQGSTNEDELIGTFYEPGDFPMLDAVFRNNRPIVFPFTETILPPEDWDLILPDEGQIDPLPILHSRYPLVMGFPLSVKDEVFGILLAQDDNIATNRERRFELLWGIAQQVSLAIQNDQLNKEMLDRHRLEREFQLARDIQQTFLPSDVPEIPGWEMDVHWETARQVGGDFYDYFLLPNGCLAFVIADVSDKGLAAALYMTVTRTLLRAAARESTSPAETLQHVNDLLLMNSQRGFFVTAFYGILNLHDGSLTYTIAGHNPPILARSQANEVVEFEKGGIALGAMTEIHLDEEYVQLEPGDCLLLYTDGVTEAFNIQDQMYGMDRLLQTLNKIIGEPASIVLETLEADLESFRGEAPLSDDTTILAICRSHH